MTSDSQIIVYSPDVNFTERKSALNNKTQEVVTVGQLKGYKSISFLITQSGTSDATLINGSDAILKGVTYEIASNPNNEDLSSIGAYSNESNTFFIANQDVEPGTFSNDLELVYDGGLPVIKVLEDTIGMYLYFIYIGIGHYGLSSYSIFEEGKVFPLVGSTILPSSTAKVYRAMDEYIAVKSYSSGSTLANNIFNDTPVEIRIYE